MMQPAAGMVPPPMSHTHMDQQHLPQQPPSVQPQHQQWAMMPPQYNQPPQVPPPMWNQQPSQIPPPLPVPPQQPLPVQVPSQPQPVQYQVPARGPASAQLSVSADEIRSLWIGDMQYWMDDTYLHSCFASSGEVVSIKVIRNKLTGQSEGYGFLEFTSRAAAERVLQAFNGQLMPNAEQTFRLNWATYGAGEKRSDDSNDFTIFVGDLAGDVTDFMLQETFRSHYPSVKGAKVVIDRITGRSKGYGFVRFDDANEQTRAMTEMNGMFCSTRPMRIGPATIKKTVGAQPKASYQTTQSTQSDNDPNNTTIFVGGLDSSVTDELLNQVFGQYGELISVKIPVGKRCGFVQFASRACAEEALLMLNGAQLGGQNIRLSWGRSPANKQPQQDSNQWNGGYYGYGQGYDAAAYGYAPPPQDPNIYPYGTYPGYANYSQQQQ
uniref:Polyadenylate-binding protein RBP45 n=1 Tax=Anthurium amnicola TaxID=1678845 RepID=A0A1D1XVN0_9ARAE